MKLPYGEIKDNMLIMKFSTADFSIASVLNAIKIHIDVIENMGVTFLGAQTDIVAGPTPVFQPVPVIAQFEYVSKGSAKDTLEKVYKVVWQGIVASFPDETCWSDAKESYAAFITAQADLLRARVEASKE
ncbi:hypothetical protein AMJ83_11095 [candidate division WOR_3 bacterium SM23_42]|uniref:Uncharacterized protein n=1 Tax=candidate division WOR_3 bacterium SM23_42 TaxID=1703779 RepID=A0A0S8FNT0_UNCW3|nr:MAG: hypothetical protein AMJ83_11095 [candidate division WOR_3 bacterium SM23_42]